MKKFTVCLLGLILSFCLCACNSGGAQRGDNPVPDKAQSIVSKNPNSSVAPSRDDSQNRQLAQLLLAKESEWTFTDRMNETGFAGLYATGYMLFDIDLDGNKELLVQLGTTDKLPCETIAFRFDEKGNLSRVKRADNLSYSAENLSLWTDEEGNSFYLNHYVKSLEKGSQEVWSKLYYDNDMIKETVCFYVNYSEKIVSSDAPSTDASSTEVSTDASSTEVSSTEVTSTASNSTEVSSTQVSSDASQTNQIVEYFIAGQENAVEKAEFDKAFNEFRGSLDQTNIKKQFINSTSWEKYTDVQKENALLNGLR